jgi:hypothetical protein
MDNLPIAYDWILLLDADQVLTSELADEIRQAIQNPAVAGYRLCLEMHFLGRVLHHSDASFWKVVPCPPGTRPQNPSDPGDPRTSRCPNGTQLRALHLPAAARQMYSYLQNSEGIFSV